MSCTSWKPNSNIIGVFFLDEKRCFPKLGKVGELPANPGVQMNFTVFSPRSKINSQ